MRVEKLYGCQANVRVARHKCQLEYVVNHRRFHLFVVGEIVLNGRVFVDFEQLLVQMQRVLAEIVQIKEWHFVYEDQLERVKVHCMLVLVFGLVKEPIEQIVFHRNAHFSARAVVIIESNKRVPKQLDILLNELEVFRRAECAVNERQKLQSCEQVHSYSTHQLELDLIIRRALTQQIELLIRVCFQVFEEQIYH
jgi:hypothetical protein